MSITIEFPKIQEKVAGVYIFTIDKWWVYVGSSRNIKQRFAQWKSQFKKNKIKSLYILDALKSKSKLKFEIVEVINQDRIEYLRCIEYWYINKLEDITYKGKFIGVLNQIGNGPGPFYYQYDGSDTYYFKLYEEQENKNSQDRG